MSPSPCLPPSVADDASRLRQPDPAIAKLTTMICELSMVGATSMVEEEEKVKLPLDLMYEVLTWCDVNALSSHRLVCKNWRRLVSCSHFINLHLQRTKTLRGFFLQTALHGEYNVSFVTPTSLPPALQSNLDFLPEPVKIEASTGGQAGHGLLCCVNQQYPYKPRYYVCKPTTREWTRIPNPHMRFSTIKMGMGVLTMGNPSVFKIVRLSMFENFQAKCQTYYTEVFDSAKWEWEILRSNAFLKSEHLDTIIGTGLLINTSIYWLSVPLPYMNGVALLMVFDIETKEWLEVGLPESFVTKEAGKCDMSVKVVGRYDLKLVNMGGDLALICMNGTQVDVWLMVSKMNQGCWLKKESFRLKETGWKPTPLVLGLFAADVALVTEWRTSRYRSLQWYNFKINDYMEARDNLEFYEDADVAHFFQSDYVPCNIGQKQCNFPTELPSSSNSCAVKRRRP